MHWKDRLAVAAAALWWGSLTTIGFVAVPVLFAYTASPATAGRMAARLFTAQTWVSLACCMVLMMMAARGDLSARPLAWARGALAWVVMGMLLALLIEFLVGPRILARQNLPLWHNLGSAMYLAQWACAGVALWKVTARD